MCAFQYETGVCTFHHWMSFLFSFRAASFGCGCATGHDIMPTGTPTEYQPAFSGGTAWRGGFDEIRSRVNQLTRSMGLFICIYLPHNVSGVGKHANQASLSVCTIIMTIIISIIIIIIYPTNTGICRPRWRLSFVVAIEVEPYRCSDIRT